MGSWRERADSFEVAISVVRVEGLVRFVGHDKVSCVSYEARLFFASCSETVCIRADGLS
jgi:hypothetical protein